MAQFKWGGVAIVAALLTLGCDSEETASTPACVQTLCTAGSTTCLGNAAATCSADGTSYTVTECGSNQQCLAGACEARQCPFVGQQKCKDGATLQVCSDDGKLTEETCGDDTQCKGGACRPIECTASSVECGFREFATCASNGNGWDTTACNGNEICENGACVAETCTPEARRCKDETTAETCNLNGTGWVETACGEGEECSSTYNACVPKICETASTDSTDTAGTDMTDMTDMTEMTDGTDPNEEICCQLPNQKLVDLTRMACGDADGSVIGPVSDCPEPPPLEMKPIGEVTINGEKIEFTSNKSATYVAADQDLRISMDKGQQKVEISISPIEEFDFGVFKSSEASETNVVIFYHDGSELVGMAQFRYQSVDYEVSLEKFEGKGGRVVGTFSGTFTDDGGATTIPFVEGKFDVPRQN